MKSWVKGHLPSPHPLVPLDPTVLFLRPLLLLSNGNVMQPTNLTLSTIWYSSRSSFKLFALFKGQLISESLFDALNFPKEQLKNLMNFCPRI